MAEGEVLYPVVKVYFYLQVEFNFTDKITLIFTLRCSSFLENHAASFVKQSSCKLFVIFGDLLFV